MNNKTINFLILFDTFWNFCIIFWYFLILLYDFWNWIFLLFCFVSFLSYFLSFFSYFSFDFLLRCLLSLNRLERNKFEFSKFYGCVLKNENVHMNLTWIESKSLNLDVNILWMREFVKSLKILPPLVWMLVVIVLVVISRT